MQRQSTVTNSQGDTPEAVLQRCCRFGVDTVSLSRVSVSLPMLSLFLSLSLRDWSLGEDGTLQSFCSFPSAFLGGNDKQVSRWIFPLLKLVTSA